MYDRFRLMFDATAARARLEEPALPPFSPLASRMVVAGITDVVGEEVRQGRIDRLPDVEPELSGLVIALLEGPPARRSDV
jgi:hypothetical protein